MKRNLLIALFLCVCTSANAKGLLPPNLEVCGVNYSVTKDDLKSEEIKQYLRAEGVPFIKNKLVAAGIDAYSEIKPQGYLFLWVEYFEGLESQNMPPGPYSITVYYYPPESGGQWAWFERRKMTLNEYNPDRFKDLIADMTDEFINDLNAKQIKEIDGEYVNQHKVRMTKWDQSDPTKDIPVEVLVDVKDTLTLKETGRHVEVAISINADMGHTCDLYGKANLLDDVIIYDESFDGTDDHCTMKIRRTEDGLQLHDVGGICQRYYCGVRGMFDGVTFKVSK